MLSRSVVYSGAHKGTSERENEMTAQAGEKMSAKRGTFCTTDCMYNPNGCSYCGRQGPAVGVREAGTAKTLSGRTIKVYRECVALEGRHHKPEWRIRIAADGRTAMSATTINSFQPNDTI